VTILKSRVHIIGIGGAGMSGIARILLASGIDVSGSDAKESRRLQALAPLGATVIVGHDAKNLVINNVPASVVVVSTAIDSNNPEVVKAIELGIPVVSRADALSELMSSHKTVSVAGTHGKTTTTSMVTVALQQSGLDPSFAIGSELNESGSNAHLGNGEWFVAEADESDGTFLVLPTNIAIVTNVEADHLDHWGNFEAIEAAFVDFIVNTNTRSGSAVVCGDDIGAAKVAKLARERGAQVTTYGEQDFNDAVVRLIPSHDFGQCFSVTMAGQTHGPIQLRVPGAHNALNASAAFLALLQIGVTPEKAMTGLAKFSGTRRRFEARGQADGVRIFDDYAHHPTEIEAVLKAARNVAGSGKVIVAFQAHHYYRTALFSKEFGQALGLADFVVVLEVFAPGEQPIPGATGSTMAGNVPLAEDCVVFEPSWSNVPGHLVQAAYSGDIIMTLGAGDIGMMCPQILDLLSRREEI